MASTKQTTQSWKQLNTTAAHKSYQRREKPHSPPNTCSIIRATRNLRVPWYSFFKYMWEGFLFDNNNGNDNDKNNSNNDSDNNDRDDDYNDNDNDNDNDNNRYILSCQQHVLRKLPYNHHPTCNLLRTSKQPIYHCHQREALFGMSD